MAAPDAPAPYQVVVSAAVRQRLRELAGQAAARGDKTTFITAVQTFLDRLAVYPQFGDPLIDLTAEPGVIYTGIVRPLSMRYGVYEGRRLVLVVAPPVLLPMDTPDVEAGE